MTSAVLRIGYVGGWSPVRAPGLARYSTELLAALRRATPDHVPLELLEMSPARGGAARVAWTQGRLPWLLRRTRPDVLHLTSYPAPVVGRHPTVLTLHDLSMLREPATHPRRRVIVMTPLLRAAARGATRVIVPSHATRDDAERLLDLDPARIHVIHEAPAARFRRITDPATLADVARRHALRPGFLLTIGTLEPRKNLPALVAAWTRLRTAGWGGQLVLAGADGWRINGLDAVLADADSARDIRRLGRVDDEDLPALLSLAGAFAYPSLLEGFGLPVVEALACGVPTVTSDRGATAEMAGDAALLVDPSDVSALAAGIERALTPGPERDRLVAAGPVRAGAFEWDTAARETARVYGLVAEARA